MDIQIDLARFDKLLASFHILTKYRIAFFDANFNKVICYPKEECRFCQAIRSVNGGQALCKASDEKAFQHCLSSNDLYRYTCHAGLTEASIALQYNGVTVGFIIFGQICPVPNGEQRQKRLLPSIKSVKLSDDDKKEIIEEIIYQDDEQIQAASALLIAIGKYAITSKLFSFKRGEFIDKVDNYIAAHYAEKINSSTVAEALNISRTELYELCNQYLHMGIAQYILQKRVQRACSLLSSTKMPISDVSDMVGFSEYSYFSKVFKQMVGLSAKAYRKAHSSD